MVHNITVALEIAENRINVKATTTEHLGFEGRMEGISAYAVCTVSEGKQATVSDQ
jgi:2C-methyl-D-erythritol 2,4-cyclodiphosphate synthase